MQFAPVPFSGYAERRGRGRFWDARSPVLGGRHFAQKDGLIDISSVYSKSNGTRRDGKMDASQILVNLGATNKDGDRVERSVEDSALSSSGQSVSNLSRFLESTTPRVTTQLHSKGCLAASKHHFALNDLWDSFDEWSAYGAGVPIILYGNEAVVQYYVPYLSAIQLYTSEGSGLFVKSSDAGCEMAYRDNLSEISSDSEAGALSSQECCLAKNSQEAGSLGLDNQLSRKAGNEVLIFEFLEAAVPSLRVPLFDKVNELAHQFPGIRSLCSNDLSWSSWLSVAWYPIYRIPTGPTLKDLDACFLTYHHLSTVQADGSQGARIGNASCKLPLCPFGLSSYKFRDSLWISAGAADCQSATSLQSSSEEWLKQLGVHHPDFEYFMCHRVPTWHQNS